MMFFHLNSANVLDFTGSTSVGYGMGMGRNPEPARAMISGPSVAPHYNMTGQNLANLGQSGYCLELATRAYGGSKRGSSILFGID